VTVDGATISGLAVSEATWEEALLSEFKAANEAAAGDFAEKLDRVNQDRREALKDAEENALLLRQIGFVHFLDPTVISGNVQVNAKPTRVALSKVSSWFPGRVRN